MFRHLVGASLCVLLAAPSMAQEAEAGSEATPKGLLPIPDYSETASPFLFGDWGDARQVWADQGVQVDAFLTQVGQGVVRGGKDTGWSYGGKFETSWRFDLDRMDFMPGAFVTMRTESRYGQSVNGSAGTLLPVNDVLYFPLTDELDENTPIAITELRYTQFLTEQFALFLGKFVVLGGDANEFAGGRGDTQFISHTFMSASVTALMNPYSTVGGGVVIMPTPDVVITSSLYASTDSSTTTGLDTLGDGLVWSTSIRNRYELGGLPGGMMLTGQFGFDNDFINFQGAFVGDGAFQLPLEEDTWSAFWNGWQYLAVMDDSKKPIDVTNGRADRRGYGLFARAGYADQGTNPVPWIVSGGIGGLGILDSRPLDSFGVGYSYSELRSEPFVTGSLLQTNGSRFEAYYILDFGSGVEVSVDAQYAESVLARVPSATLLGMRLRLQF